MELFGLPLWLVLLVLIIVLLVFYAFRLSSNHGTFKKMGIDTPPYSMVFGHFGEVAKLGLFQSQKTYYSMFKDKKVYGVYDFNVPALALRDPDMIKDVMVKHFNKFVNRRSVIQPDPPFDHSLLFLKDERWKHVRNAVSPTFSSGRIKKMVPHVQRKAKLLLENIKEKHERNEEIELKDMLFFFTMDVIATTAFGYEVNSLKDPTNEITTKMRKVLKGNGFALLIMLLFPPVVKVLKMLNIYLYAKKEVDYLIKFIDNAVDSRRAGETKRVNDFLDLVVNAEKDEHEERSLQESADQSDKSKDLEGLSREEIQAQALSFLMAGAETVATVMSFLLFSLAQHPEICSKVLEEIDEKLGKDFPSFDNVQSLHYLDMCINEVLRMYSPAPMVDRVCSEDVTIQGINIPKGMVIYVPIHAIHYDPDIWPEPEKFDPERFSPDNKDSRHPYVHLPFGQGPRNCIGMRLGQVEVKIAVAAVLQSFKPVPCSKTVYPVKLNKMAVLADDGLWVKFEARE